MRLLALRDPQGLLLSARSDQAEIRETIRASPAPRRQSTASATPIETARAHEQLTCTERLLAADFQVHVDQHPSAALFEHFGFGCRCR